MSPRRTAPHRWPRAAALGVFLAFAAGATADPPPSVEQLELSPRVVSEQKGEKAPVARSSVNDLVVKVVKEMPSGGGYAASGKSFTALGAAIRTDASGRLALSPEVAKPSFCSGGTYLVFLSVLDHLSRDGRLTLSPEVVKALQMQHQADGAGIWGRWNANGPGTARLFQELGLGQNFTSFDQARKGDFMKVWWNDEIGAKEHGHSVIYLGTSTETKDPTVTFWSANVPDGYGVKNVPLSRIRRALFSRLEKPGAIEEAAAKLPARDAYLAEMLKRGSSEKEMFEKVGIRTGGR